jgi:Domain of unknown function (DUF4082)/Bacterial Ig domain
MLLEDPLGEQHRPIEHAVRTLVCYKESYLGTKIDPEPGVWTGTWRDPTGASFDAGRPENALTGTLFTVNGLRYDTISVSAPFRSLRFWRNTPLASLPSDHGPVSLAPYVLGFEWDEDVDDGSRPGWPVALSSTTVSLVGEMHLRAGDPGFNNGDPGTNFRPGTGTHSLMLYRHSSGALVFGAGTTRWGWGLDSHHDAADVKGPAPTTDPNIQQATVNMLADMGVQPASLQPGLHPSAQTSDTTPPTSSITSPSAGSSIRQFSPVMVAGTASDADGIVAGVEVSVDGGSTWHPAFPSNESQGLESWCYSWVPLATGNTTIQCRAVDDSANQETPGPGVTVTVTSAVALSLWNNSVTPSVQSADDPAPVELGARFTTDMDGFIVGLRFYKGLLNTGTYVANLWSAAEPTWHP